MAGAQPHRRAAPFNQNVPFYCPEVGKDAIKKASGPLKTLLSNKKITGRLPYLSVALFVITAKQDGGVAAAADLAGVDRNVVREFIEEGWADVAVNPWLLYDTIDSPGVGQSHSFHNCHTGKFSGTAILQKIYQKYDGSLIYVFEGRDGSTYPGQIVKNGKAGLPSWFPFFDPPLTELEQEIERDFLEGR